MVYRIFIYPATHPDYCWEAMSEQTGEIFHSATQLGVLYQARAQYPDARELFLDNEAQVDKEMAKRKKENDLCVCKNPKLTPVYVGEWIQVCKTCKKEFA